MKILYPALKKPSLVSAIKKYLGVIVAMCMVVHGFAQVTTVVTVANAGVTVCAGTTVTMVSTAGIVGWYNKDHTLVATGTSYTTPKILADSTYYYVYQFDNFQNAVSIKVFSQDGAAFTAPYPALCLSTAQAFTAAASCSGNSFLGNGVTTRAASPLNTYPSQARDNLTMEAKVKWSGANAGNTSQCVMLNGNSSGWGYAIYVDGATQKVEVLLGGVSLLTSSAQFTVGKWQHVAAVRDTGSWSLYVDGVEYALSNKKATPNTPFDGAFFIGGNNANTEHFNGAIDEVRIWEKALDLPTVNGMRQKCRIINDVSLMGYWKFDETSGLQVIDASGKNFNLSLNSASRGMSASFDWNFGDGTAAGTAVTHSYSSIGSKNITLTVRDIEGCTLTSAQTLTVNNAHPVAPDQITASSTIICAGTAIDLSITDKNLYLGTDFNGDEIFPQGWAVIGSAWTRDMSIGDVTTPDGSGVWSADHYLLGGDGVLQSPAFSTAGATGLSIVVQEYANILVSNIGAYIQMSSDSAHWTNVAVYSNSVGKYNQFDTRTIPVPAAFENKPKVYLRFYYKDSTEAKGTQRDLYAVWALNSVFVYQGSIKPSIIWTSTPTGLSATGLNVFGITPAVTTTYTAVSSSGCASPAVTKTVVVNQIPSATIKGSATSACINTPVIITFKGSNATGPYTFYYNLNGGAEQTIRSGAGDSVNITIFPTVNRTYTITKVSTGAGCEHVVDSATLTITVKTPPGAAIAGGGNFCTSGTAVNLITFTALGGTAPYIFTYLDEAGRQQQVQTTTTNNIGQAVIPSTQGSYVYNITLVTDGNGCQALVAGATATANVYTSPIVTVPANYLPYCNTPVTLTASGSAGITWSPAAGLDKTSGGIVIASPSVTTRYTATVKNAVCMDSASVTVVKTGIAPAPRASANTSCYGGQINLSAGDSVYPATPVFIQDFNKPLTGWIFKNTSTGGTPANADWTYHTNGYTYTFHGNNFTFNPGSGFYMSNAADQNGTTTSASMQSPAFSTMGFTGMQVTLNDRYLYGPVAKGKIEFSTDGSTWTDTSPRTGFHQNSDSTSFSSITFSVPAAFENKPVVYLRLTYESGTTWWAINNVLITGTPFNTWAWTSTPMGFTSTLQNPAHIFTTGDSTYNVTVNNGRGCVQTASTTKVTVTNTISGTIDPVVRILPGAATFPLSYTITQGTPDVFNSFAVAPNPIPNWPANGKTGTLPSLPSGTVNIALPFQQSIAGTYNFTWQAESVSAGCIMTGAPFTVVIGSNNNNLDYLLAMDVFVSSPFDPSVTNYIATVPASKNNVIIVPFVTDAAATVKVNGVAAASGRQTAPITLTTGTNLITAVVTAQDGTTKTYTLTITKQTDVDILPATIDAKAAYSLRSLRTPMPPELPLVIIRVRRSSDDAELDLGAEPTAGKIFDTAALKTFAGNGDAFVTKWYDQAGNGLDAVQVVKASQPRILHNGVIERKHGVPAVYFYGSASNNVFLSTGNFNGLAGGFSLFTAAGVNADNTSNTFVTKTDGDFASPWDIENERFNVGNKDNHAAATAMPVQVKATNGFAVWGFTGNSTNANAWYNGNNNGTIASTSDAYLDGNTPLIFGSKQSGASRLDGWISEIILFPSISDSNRAAVTANMMLTYIKPVISAVTPNRSGAGTFVKITGKSFSGASAVTFNNIAATSFTVVNDTLITAVVPANATGVVSVTKSSNTATFAGFTMLAPPGNALYFDGADDYVNTTANPITGSDFTIEFWMRTTQTGSTGANWYNGTGLADGDVPFQAKDFGVSLLGDKICFGTGGESDFSITSNTSVNTGRWAHIATVRSQTNGTISIYINGVLDNIHTAATGMLNDAALTYLTIGANRDLSNRFKGSIDELRFFNTDRSANIKADMLGTVSPSATAAYYTFDAGTPAGNNTGANILSDVSNNSNNGVLNNQFALTDTISNWVESYAMVVPTAAVAGNITSASFSANWIAPVTGMVDSFKVSVATDAAFNHIVTGYDSAEVPGTATSLVVAGLAPATTYYYRVRAHKASVAGQGAYDSVISVTTAPLVITGISPAAAYMGTPITISGSGFTGLTGVSFGGEPAIAVTFVSDNTIIATVGKGSSGNVTVTVAGGAVTKTSAFTLLTQTQPGNALNFNGTANYVKTGSNPITGGDFTIEFWMKANQPGAADGTNWWNGTGLVDADIPFLANDFGISLLGNKICFGTGGTSDLSIISKTSIDIGHWVHVAAVRSQTNGTISLYINGLLDTVHSANTSLLAAPAYLTIGANHDLSHYFNGAIDELRLFNTARSGNLSTDVLQPLNLPIAGLAAAYNFNEGQFDSNGTGAGVTLLLDQSGNNLTDTLMGFSSNNPNTVWRESYAMVAPVVHPASAITNAAFTIDWSSPVAGTVTKYLLDVSTKEDFSSFVNGYNTLNVDNVTAFDVKGLSGNTTYFYRVRADKTTVTGQGAYSNIMRVTTGLPLAGVSSSADTICSNAGLSPITFTGSNGIAPYTFSYSINGSGNYTATTTGTYDTVNVPVPPAAGDVVYTLVSVRDNAGNTQLQTGSATINILTPAASTTFISVCASTLPYNWNGTGYTAAGNYTIHLTNARGCDSAATLILTIAANPTAAIRANQHITTACYGLTRNIIATPAGGTAPYLYSIDGTTWQDSARFAAPAGTYHIIVKDNNGCTANTPGITITQPATPLTITSTVVNTANITVTATGGYGGYTYGLNDGAFIASNTLTGVSAGIDTVRVHDQGGCVAAAHVNILTATIIYDGGNNMVCYNRNKAITIIAAGGVRPYRYTFDGNTAGRIMLAAPGTHTITVQDAAGNSYSTGITITAPAEKLNLTLAHSNATCAGGDGSITALPSGGYAGYTYSINSGSYAGENVFNNLDAGTYTVSVMDAAGCTSPVRTAIVKVPVNPCPGLRSGDEPTSSKGEMAGALVVKVMPNPAVVEFTLQVVSGDSKKVVEIRVMDMLGRTVYHTRGSVFDSYRFGRNFAGGMYIAEVLNGTSVQRVKLVKGN